MNIKEYTAEYNPIGNPQEIIVQSITQRISEKSYSIESLTNDLNNLQLTEDERKIINDIINDEKDHIVLLTAMLQDRVECEYDYDNDPCEDLSELVIVKESISSDQALTWIENNLNLSNPTQDKDGSYVYTLSDSKEFGKIYSKLDKNNGVTELKSSTMVTDDYSSIYFRRVSEPKFTINLQADFIANDYSLIIVEE